MPKILALANGNGGVGKTTTAVNLAAILAGLFPTLFVDADVQASAQAWIEQGQMPLSLAQETHPESYSITLIVAI